MKSKNLPQNKDIVIYGPAKEIEIAITVLSSNYDWIISQQDIITGLYKIIQCYNLKADILFNGNTIWNGTRILKDIKKVKIYGMMAMSNYLYKFCSLACGSIAHYNKMGWIECYPTLQDFKNFFQKNEMGQAVYNYVPCWRPDVKDIVKNIQNIL